MTIWTALALLAFALALTHAVRVEAWRRAFQALLVAPPTMPPAGDDVRVTVLVPARDAAATLTPLLQDLHAQTHPRELVQVLVVDDHSSDDTATLVERMGVRWPQLQLVKLGDAQGKKAAIMAGVKSATGEVIIVTDADARCGPERVAAVVRHRSVARWDMLLMPVRTVGDGLVGLLQEEEQAALLGAAVGLTEAGAPLLANGANMAFTRTAFEAVGGYTGDRWASGDDVFLVERMRRDGRHVAFLLDPAVLVTVEAEHTWGGFLRQRLRWAGKMRGVRGTGGKLLAAVGMLLPWVLLAVSLVLAGHVRIGQGWLFIWGVMAVAWCAWLVPVLGLGHDAQRFLSTGGSSVLRSAVALVAFTLYAPVIAVLALVWRPLWKGRRT